MPHVAFAVVIWRRTAAFKIPLYLRFEMESPGIHYSSPIGFACGALYIMTPAI